MKVLTLSIPDSLEFDNAQLAMFFAAELYKQGKLSLGQAAEIAGVSKRVFIEIIGRYNVSVFNSKVADLSNDVLNA
ncbi:MAG: UPF0175 family protein [Bacteroidetes bacterium]|nr:UPF0175 family protein [Bacteroidota bacterium]MBK8343979.1 UPF0175 family protein [Bacteroidota bacterium]